MKNKTCQQLILITVFTLFLTTLSAAGSAAEYVSVKKDGVNIRSGPSTNDKIIWQIFESFPLQILERQGKWAHVVDYEGDKGWIYETLISSKKTVIVTVDTGNMRSGPGTDDPVIATVKKGVVFDALEMKDGWIKVRYKDELTGWMYNNLLWPSNPF